MKKEILSPLLKKIKILPKAKPAVAPNLVGMPLTKAVEYCGKHNIQFEVIGMRENWRAEYCFVKEQSPAPGKPMEASAARKAVLVLTATNEDTI